MKGVILAGGTGSRLRPITHTGPKQLVPIANKPVIDYAIEDLKEAGIDDVGVIVGHVGSDEIQAHLGDGSDHGVDVTYIVQGEPLGLAHAVGCARDFVGDEPFVVYLGDDLMREGITELVADFDQETYAASIGLQEVDDPSRYGIVDVDDEGNVQLLVEKPDDPPNNLALIGIYVFTSDIFEQIDRLEPSWRGELEITEAIQGLLDDGKRIQSHTVHGWWKDTGKPEDVLHANYLVLDDIDGRIDGTVEDGAVTTGRVDLGAGSVVEAGAVVKGPVSIGENTTIGSDAYVGPYTSVGDDCELRGVHIESSVVIGESTITTERKIVDSLVGRKATIRNTEEKKPDGTRLVVGENSTLDL
ncbi:glucose-1-phosphate thymidylyltransferase [Halogeometricum sp. CBA1124]|uniref:glucose-1-phosphate thymidylyltransferase n=1 Tax=Halogeometricum sp. CBA1124 TaxID=2668071 RepID=UPI00142B6D03|nr:glucose-1-phosphate thymidylyltransferase [Halogeometricum sp. CBA1124]MUV57110.1 glucose-1-phosphate thymidylyltransferase [Halogeometricum sp. CBA1124]